MRKIFMTVILALLTLVSCNKGDNDPRLVIITFDGLRWQEVFSGADEGIISDSRYVQDQEALKKAYWRESAQERREALMPFVWSYVPQHGYLLGNREKNSLMQVSNSMNFSYPGYSEMFCGYADDARINSNDPIPNPNTSVMEVVNQDPRYKGQVMMYSSWESIRYAMNNDRGGFPGSAAHEAPYVNTAIASLLQDMDERGLVASFGSSERDDAITCGFALETLKEKHPKVFYVGFGDTDEYGHSGRYDKYLIATHASDGYIRRIVETCEADPFYKGKTTYILTTDHGRGQGSKFTDHGSNIRPSRETWFMAFGKGVPVMGETADNGPSYTKQFAATIADILGVDFTPDNGEKCSPLDPTYYKEPEAPVASAHFDAVTDAKPKGQGLRYTYVEGDIMSVPQMKACPVKASGVTPVFGTQVKKREDHFGILFKGLMKLDKGGLYLFSFSCDDGAILFLDGKELYNIDRDGGGYQESWLDLAPGYHRLEVQYWENYGNEDVSVGLSDGKTGCENLPANMLYYE